MMHMLALWIFKHRRLEVYVFPFLARQDLFHFKSASFPIFCKRQVTYNKINMNQHEDTNLFFFFEILTTFKNKSIHINQHVEKTVDGTVVGFVWRNT